MLEYDATAECQDDIDWANAFETYHPALMADLSPSEDWRIRIDLHDFGRFPSRTIVIGFGALVAAILGAKP